MADSINLGIKITADGKGAESTINSLNRTIEKVGDSSRKASQSLGGIEKATQSLGSAATVAGQALAGLGVAMSARALYNTISEFDKLNASLKTVTGSVAGASAAMGMIRNFAASTPYDIQQVTEAFIRLRSLGLDATAASLKSYGNTASAMGKPIMQFVEAVADATTNEFERLKEFGIKAKQQGDTVTFTFQGISTTVAKNATDIQNYLLQMGNTQFASGMVDQMNTVGGAASNLQDAFSNLVDDLGNLGIREALKKGFAGASEFINEFRKQIDELAGATQTSFRDALERRIKEQESVVSQMKNGLGGFMGLFTDTEEIAQREREIASMKQTLARMNSELATQTAEGIGKAIEQGIQTAAPPKTTDIMQMVAESAKKYNIPEAFALAIAKTESNFNQGAVSNKGAMGVMQLMPATAQRFGVDAKDAAQNIDGGMRYLKFLSAKFHGDLRLIAAAYNAGENRQSLREGRVPDIKETQDYVKKVDAAYQQFLAKYPGGTLFSDSKSQQQEFKDAEDRYKTHLESMVSAAERAAREEESRRKTVAKQIELDQKRAEDQAKQAIDSAPNQQAKIAAAEQLRAIQESAAQRSKQLIDEQINSEQNLLQVKQMAIADELANADKYNLSITQRAQLERELLGIQSEMRMLSDDRAMAEIAAAERQLSAESQLQSMLKSKSDAEKAVADEQLRLNQAYANGVQQAQLFATQASQAFGQVGEAVGKMVVGVMQFSEQLYQIDRDRQNALKKISKGVEDGSIDPSKQAELTAKEQMKWADKSAQYQIAMMGDITDASKGFFKEGSKGYKAMEMATKAFRMFEMAMAVKSMVTQLMGIETITGAQKVAAVEKSATDTAMGAAAAPAAVAEAGAQSGWPGAIAMAALMAALGFGVLGMSGSSGSASSRREDRQKTQGTGTVFGDATAQSASIANSLEIIKSNSTNDLNYSAAMLRALEDLSNSILALANQVTMNVMPSIDAAIQASGMQFGKQNISLFSGFNTQVTDSGIGWFEASLSRILKGDFTAKMYADITKSFEVMGSAISESTKTYVRDASSEVSNQVVMIFRDIVTAFQEGVKAFGLTTDSVLTALKGFKVGMEQISLKDMTMEEQTAALNAVFSKITDQMAGRLNKRLSLDLGPFRQAGEGMAETFFRVSEGISRAKGEMERLGLTAIDYKDIIAKQGDVAAEITRQTLTSQTQLTDGLKAYVNELTGSAEDIIDAYKKLVQARNSMVTAGFGDTNLDRTMINAAGGLDAFVSAMESFNENFLSQADRYAGDVRVLSEQFGKLGYDLPASKEEFVKLAFSLNDGTESGKKLFGQMIALSDAFAKVADQAENIRAKYANILDPFKSFSDQITQVGKDFNTLLGGLVGDSAGRISTIENNAAKLRDSLTGNRSGLVQDLANQEAIVKSNREAIIGYQERLDKELAKKPKNQNKALIKKLESYIQQAESSIYGLLSMSADVNDRIAAINQQIANVDAQEGIDKAAELARLSVEKQGIINDAQRVMSSTLEDVFNGIVQSIQAAQQRLESVISVQKSLASQLAQLQGPGAVFNLASANRNEAFGAIDQYIAGVKGGGARDVATEVTLLQTAQQAVMDKYNAEIAEIQEAEQAFIAAETERLNAALQLQIDAINAATEAAIKAENDRLNAAVKVQQKIDEQAIKSQQKAFDAANKLTQKAFDAEQKALQKIHDEKLQALQDEMDAATKLRDAIKSIADYAAGMRLGQNSTLSPEARLAEAQRQYQELQAKASGGDAEAMQRLTGASDAYLEAAKTYYGSSTNYQDIFDGVQRAMESIGGMSAPDPDSIQSRIDQLREAQAAEMDALRELQAEKLDAIREGQQDQLDAIREQQQGSIDAMREASQAQQDAIRKAAQSQIESLQKATQQAISDLSDPTKNRAMAEAKAAAERDMKELQRLAELSRIEAQRQADLARDEAAKQAEAAWNLANAQLKALGDANGLSAATLQALNGILNKNGITPIPIPAYAKGGMAQPGLALVGEQGPELVRFNRPGQVYTAQETKSLLGNDEKVVKAIEALKAEMRAVAVTQSNANPQIIEKLAGMEQRLSQMERTQKLAVTR